MTIDRTGRRPPPLHPHRATVRWLTGLIIVGFIGPVSLFAQPRLYVQAVDSLGNTSFESRLINARY